MKQAIEQKYTDLLGFVPDGIRTRLALAEKVGRMQTIEVVEQYREQLIYNTPVDSKYQQLIHLAMLIALKEEGPARLHVKGALKAGASKEELFAICETAAIVGGMPLFQRAVDLVAEGLEDTE